MLIYPWQQSQWQQMCSLIEHEKIPHALLLSAREGMGVEQFAHNLALKLLCSSTKFDELACGECKSCILIRAGNHPDLKLIRPEEAGKQIKIELIRDLIRFIQLSSQYYRYKICIIEPAEAMNRSSANSLLKTLEEPPPQSLIILVSYQTSRIPVTIRSRCQQINFSADSSHSTLEWIKNNISESQYSAADLLEFAGGGPIAAVELHHAGEEDSHEALIIDLQELSRHSIDPVKMAQKWHSEGGVAVFKRLMMAFNKMARLKLQPTPDIKNQSRIIGYLQDLSNELDLILILSCYTLALKNYYAITGPISLNQQGLLEDMIIFWQTLNRNHRGT